MSIRVFPPGGALTEPEQEPPLTRMGLIESRLLSAPAAVVTISNIPQTGNTLVVCIRCLDTSAAVASSPGYLKLNNDGAAGNYAAVQCTTSAGAGSAGQSILPLAGAGVAMFRDPGTLTQATASATFVITIPFYSNPSTAFFKSFLSDGTERAVGANTKWNCASVWVPNGAITRLDFTSGATSFAVNSCFQVFVY